MKLLSCESVKGTTVPRKRTRLRIDNELLTRTSWVDAETALLQIRKGKASGNPASLWLRAKLQNHLYQLGCFVQRHAGKVLFVGLLVLSTFCVGLKSATMETDVEKLWVEEGGRLEKELKYIRSTLGEGAGSTNQILIQTPKGPGTNLLHADALLVHMNAVKAATEVTVEMFDVTWRLRDICYSPSLPSFDAHNIDSLLENIFPCAIITPLDCFWEGAKLLGPEFPVYIPGLGLEVKWTNLNPKVLVNTMKSLKNYASSFPFSTLEDFLKRAGITTGYQERPCLNPNDELCPASAPNKASGKLPNVGAELTGGCYGFATNYMHWPEDLIVGGVTKNKTGHIVKAEALQTVVQLMAEKEMYELYRDTYRVHNMDWSIEKSRMILEAWQKRFTKEVLKATSTSNVTKKHDISVFSTSSLSDVMKEFSEISLNRVILGAILMVAYAFLSLRHWADCVQSQSGIGIVGVVLVGLSMGAGLGFCAIIGISFNASTTQIVPFLALGLGVDDMFLLAYTYAKNANSNIPLEEQTGECLKRIGVSILLTSVSNMCAFFAAAIIPIPALRAFVLQVAILILFHIVVTLLVFPAVVSLDLRRHHAHRMDIFCCFHGACYPLLDVESGRRKDQDAPKKQTVTHALPPDLSQVVTVLATPSVRNECWVDTASREVNEDEPDEDIPENCYHPKDKIFKFSLTWLAAYYYAPLLRRKSVKVLTVLTFLFVMVASVWGLLRVNDGLDLTDIVPRGTNEFKFLRAQSRYFGFFNMFAITRGNFEYPTNQKLLYEYHEAFTRIDKIIKNDNGGTPDFWLSLFRDWLSGLQKAFDEDYSKGHITREYWYPNASDEGILAYKLMVQTGRVDNPIDKSLIGVARLVDSDGVISPKAFYNYLTAWVSNDALAYSASQANFHPEPRQWTHVAQDVELKIPKSQPLIYAQLPFYLNNMGKTEDITKTILDVRAICDKFEERGLPNFPSGIPFVFWEQYIGLRFYLMLALVCVLAVIFLVITIVLLNPWCAFIVVIILSTMVIQLFGVMGFLGIKLSAVPAVILITVVGIGVEFTVHITVGFLTSIGNRNHRMAMTLQHTFTPVIHGSVSTLLGVLMLAFSEFDFIIRYFFHVLLAFVVIGLLNGLLLLPVLLSLLGPPAEVVPRDHANRISTPSPRPSPQRQRAYSSRSRDRNRERDRDQDRDGYSSDRGCGGGRSHSSSGFSKRIFPRVNSEISLSTISEEPASYHSSHEIVVSPELVLETTTITDTGHGITSVNAHTNTDQGSGESSNSSTPVYSDKERCGSSTSTSSSTSTNTLAGPVRAVTTKVTATAKVKVEVHAPVLDAGYRRHRRDSCGSGGSSNGRSSGEGRRSSCYR